MKPVDYNPWGKLDYQATYEHLLKSPTESTLEGELEKTVKTNNEKRSIYELVPTFRGQLGQ